MFEKKSQSWLNIFWSKRFDIMVRHNCCEHSICFRQWKNKLCLLTSKFRKYLELISENINKGFFFKIWPESPLIFHFMVLTLFWAKTRGTKISLVWLLFCNQSSYLIDKSHVCISDLLMNIFTLLMKSPVFTSILIVNDSNRHTDSAINSIFDMI